MNSENWQIVQSLYIHWPFCPYKCHFCPFVALAGQDEYMESYHNALIKEIEQFSHSLITKKPIKTIFLGGGTPSTYPENLLLDMTGILKRVYPICESAEITIEVNPGTVTESKLKTWKAAGINRLSIGVQSLNNKVLSGLNRHQKASDVLSLLESASCMFDNISVDLIVGLPGIGVDEWKNMVDQILAWPISHVSLYFLTVHEDTPLFFSIAQNKIELPQDETTVDLYLWTIDRFQSAGLEQYEISNFAAKGFKSQHNSVYWSGLPYKAFGLGAWSFDGATRTQNEKNLLKYIKNINENNDITIFSEKLDQQAKWLERVMLGLRQTSGIDLAQIAEGLSEKQIHKLNIEIEKLSQLGMLVVEGNIIKLSSKAIPVANEIIVKLTSI